MYPASARLSMSLAALALCAAVLAASEPASAQYSPPRYKGFETAPPAESERAAHAAGSALSLKAGKAARIKLDALVELRPGMRRLIRLTPGSGMESEEEILPLAQPASLPAPQAYSDSTGRILIGLGLDDSLSSRWDYYSVVSLRLDNSGNFTELERFTSGSARVRDAYILDLSGRGGLDIALPWSSGGSAAGGVDVLNITADGSLESYNGSEFASMHDGGSGFSLLDFDSDGRWELEFRRPVLCNSCGYSAAQLMRFDSATGSWTDARELLPHYYSEQDSFYRALLEQVKLFAAEPQSFKTGSGEGMQAYACTIGDKQYSLAPFLFNELGSVDPFWIDELSSFVLNIDGIIPIQVSPEQEAERLQQ